MENEIKLVNNVDGSVVSDVMLATLNSKVDTLNEAAVEIGKLRGELEVAKHLLDENIKETDRKLKDAEEHVTVTIEGKSTYNSVYGSPWGDLIREPRQISTIKVERTKLDELADAAVKAQALKDVEAAEKKQKEAEKEAKQCRESEEAANKIMTQRIKEVKDAQKEEIEKAVNKAERNNIAEIEDLKLEIKALNKENDLLQDQKAVIRKERDLLIEGYEKEIEILKTSLELSETSPKSIVDQCRSGFRWLRTRIRRA